AALVRAIARDETVELLVADEESAVDARARLDGCAVRQHLVPHQDLWLRDSGPIFVRRDAELALVDWDFNGWGNKYPAQLDDQIPAHVARVLGGVTTFHPGLVMEGGSLEVNGEGLALTTRQCLFSPERNPGVSEAALEEALEQYLGISDV